MLNSNKGILNKTYPEYFVLPALSVFCIFYLASVLLSFVLSLTDWHVQIKGISFVYLDNFKSLMKENGFLESIKNSFLFCITTTLSKTLLGLIIALFLNKHFKGANFFKAMFFMPCIISMLVIGYIFGFVLNPEGMLNSFLSFIGLGVLKKDWLGDFNLALMSIGAIETWVWSGFCATIILAGLMSVPAELEESATIDGANSFQVFRNIKLPFIMPALNIVIVLNIIGGLKVFDLIMSTTNGGPGYSTEVMSTFLYKAQSTGALGYACAIGLVQFSIITAVTLIINQVIRRREIEL